MPIRPFLFTDTVVLTANGSGTARMPISAGEKARFRALRFVATGAFNLLTIRDDSGQRYSNSSADDPIPSTLLQDARNAFRSIDGFKPDLELEGPTGLNFELTDTSAAGNTVRIVAEGEKETG